RKPSRANFSYGQFGENFTVDGLPDDEVCVGDRYRIGTALFEVSQPRVTCWRLGIRMDVPQMPALLYTHGRPDRARRGRAGRDDRARGERAALSARPHPAPARARAGHPGALGGLEGI